MSQALVGIDFYVIGAMKAATTAMCDWLDAQEGLSLSNPKEPAIFVSDAAARSWLHRVGELYEQRDPASLRGEGSTDYTKFPTISGVPDRVHRYSPDAKLVYLMRHPVERMISQYRFEWLRGSKTMSFERALEVNPSLIDNGRYAFQLRQWLDVFAPDRFLLVFAEAFSRDPQAQVRRVLEFLGVPADRVRNPPEVRDNETSRLVRRTLARRILRDSSFGKAVRPFVPEAVAAGHRTIVQQRSRPRVTDEVMKRTVNVFDEDLADLSALGDGPEITCASWDDVARAWTPGLRTL